MWIRHGALEIDIPESWRDESALLFMAPPASSALPTANPLKAVGEALAVRFGLAAGRSAPEILAEQVALVRAVDPEMTVVAENNFKCGLGEGRLVEQQMRMGDQTIRQLMACVITGPVAVMATTSAGAAAFAGARPRLLSILRSLKVPA